VVISGTKSTALPDTQRERVHFHCLERGHGRFSREIHVLSPVNTHQGTARLRDGLLILEFPKIQDKRQEARVLHIQEAEEKQE
jgi:HSP20 family molecular chaperone IbpA